MESVQSSVEDLVSYIKSTKEYQMCISLREKMKTNQDIQSLMNDIRNTQKKYIRSNYDSSIKNELDSLEKQLKEIPIYSIYLENLMRVNEMINYVKDKLNDYFQNLYS